MGQILSADTVYAVAYLTEKGRQYLFDPIGEQRFITSSTNPNLMIDLFKIVSFSMSDQDINYNILSGVLPETGDIPDVSGKNDGCIKGTLLDKETALISYNGAVGGLVVISDDTRPGEGTLDLSTDAIDGIALVDTSRIPVTATDEV
jgi:hypothetical protein